jgi:hypothetical protein
MARSRNDDVDDDDRDDDRPRRPRRGDDDDERDEDRPRRRRRDDDDDDYDDGPRGGGPKGPLDSTFANTNIVVLVLFACCCRGIALILALICFFTAKDPKAKSNAMIVMIIDGILVTAAIILQLTGALAGMMQQPGR